MRFTEPDKNPWVALVREQLEQRRADLAARVEQSVRELRADDLRARHVRARRFTAPHDPED